MRRALLIGCQTRGLVGVHADLAAMAALLERYRFADVTTLCDETADRAGILAGIAALIDRTAPDDAVVLYYSGHAWRVDLPGAPRVRGAVPRSYQGICPWDLRLTTPDDFRGILAEELSTLLADLTARTDNVTAILDCCHATGVMRTEREIAHHDIVSPGERGLPIPWTAGVERTLAALRARGLDLDRRDPECNPCAVRLLACRPHERAFEGCDGDGEAPGGLLTRALVAELAACEYADVVWEDLARRVSARVGARKPAQHPVVLGPARRFVFSRDARPAFGTTACLARDNRRFLLGGAMADHRPGDRFIALPLAGAAPARAGRGAALEPLAAALARLEVIAVHGHLAEVRVEPPDVALPDGVTALPVRRVAPRAAIAVDVRDAWRPAVRAAIVDGNHLRIAAADELPFAHIVEDARGLVALDADGLPLAAPRAITADFDLEAALADLRAPLEAAAQADALRRLAPAAGLDPALHPFELAWHELAAAPRPLLPGARVGPDTRVSVQVHNPGGLTLFVSVLLAGPGARVQLLTRSQPAGVELAPHQTFWLGDAGLTGVRGVRLDWPAALPRAAGPRRATLLAFVSDVAVDLRLWETAEPTRRAATTTRTAPSDLPLRPACHAIVAHDIVLAPR